MAQSYICLFIVFRDRAQDLPADTSYIIKIKTSRQTGESRAGVGQGQQLGMTQVASQLTFL